MRRAPLTLVHRLSSCWTSTPLCWLLRHPLANHSCYLTDWLPAGTLNGPAKGAILMRSWTDEQLREAVASSISIAGVLRRLALKAAGGNYRSIKHHIVRLNLDTSHHLG